MYDVFISYSSKEAETAEAVRDILEKNLISCWMAPDSIPPGSNYAKQIPLAIRGCQVFLLILSKKSQSSKYVLLELDMAVNYSKVIIPFMLEDFPLNDEFNFLLTGKQRYAAYQKKSEIMQTLVEYIQSITSEANSKKTAEEPQKQAFKQIPKIQRISAKQSAQKNQVEIPNKLERDAFGTIDCCPACASNRIKQTMNIGPLQKNDKQEMKLWLCLFFIPLTISAISLVFFSFLDSFGFGLYTAILFYVGSFTACHVITSAFVTRLRLRRGIYPYAMQCKECKKKFLRKKE